MTKRGGLRTVLAATLFASVLLPSSGVAQMMPGGPIGGALGALGGNRATKYEQLVQIGLAEQTLENLLQAIESAAIAEELRAVFDQMSGISGVVEEVMNYGVPEEFTREYDTLTSSEYAELTEERQKFLEEMNGEISTLEAEIALDESQMETLAMASNLAAEPRSDIIATQAQFIGDASRLEQQRRMLALNVLKQKREEIKEALELGDIKANRARQRCVNMGRCGS